jgi:hypothetical protein
VVSFLEGSPLKLCTNLSHTCGMNQNSVYQPGMPQEPHVANRHFLCVFSHEMTNGLSKLQFTIVFCDVAPTSRRRREQNGWSHNFPHRYFLPFILVLGQNFLKLWHSVAAPKYRDFVLRADDSISLIKKCHYSTNCIAQSTKDTNSR